MIGFENLNFPVLNHTTPDFQIASDVCQATALGILRKRGVSCADNDLEMLF